MRITLVLLCCPCSYDLLRLHCGVVETIAALNQVFQPLGEACCRSAVHHPTIKADRLLHSLCPPATVTDLSRRKFTQPSVKPSASAVGIQASPCLGQGHRGNVRVKQMFLTVDSPVLYTAFNGRNVREQSQRIL